MFHVGGKAAAFGHEKGTRLHQPGMSEVKNKEQK